MDFQYTPASPTELGLPHKSWWPGQREGVEQIVDMWMQGNKVVLLNGPTGSGKSLTAVASSLILANLLEKPYDVTVLTQTRDLQAQYAAEFPECKSATGRGNWQCGADHSRRANQCVYLGTDFGCEPNCPYLVQRNAAKEAPLRAINYALYGATAGLFSASTMVADEADYLGELLTNSMSADLTLLVEEYNLEIPQGQIEDDRLKNQLEDIMEDSAYPEEREVCKRGLTLLKNTRYLTKGVGNNLIPWPENRIVQDFTRQPTLVQSATVFAPDYWSKAWGIPLGYVELPCPVPPTNRPVYLMNVRKINAQTTEDEWVDVIHALDNIIASRVESKGVIHSVSNWLTDMIIKYSKYKYLMVKAAGETRMSGIAKFIKGDNGILIGPNLLRGLDLKDDLCRWVIFPKVPYPSLGDPRIKEMMKGGDDRYLIETLSALIQGSGRGIRSRDDHCETFILDSNATFLLKKTKGWLPAWYASAIQWSS